MATGLIQKNNIGYIFFGIGITNDEYNYFIDRMNPEVISLDEPISTITKSEADNIAINIYNNLSTDYTRLFCSPEPLLLGKVANHRKQSVFHEFGYNALGWLYFIDCDIFANWQHRCLYVFIIDKDVYCIAENNCPPKGTIELKIIK